MLVEKEAWKFMVQNYLLYTENAQRLYETHAKDLPIIDFHNHLSVAELAADRQFSDITALWLTPDPYKHRLMRICGIPEAYITGDADPFEKFKKFCEIFPFLAGNPVFDWSKMELSTIFGITEIPTVQTANYLWDKTGEMLSSPEFSYRGILKKFNIAYQSPVAQLSDDLTDFNGVTVAPSLRGDALLEQELDQGAICKGLDAFAAKGCRFADHALDADFFETPKKAQRLCHLGVEYAKRGWTLLLHMDAKRQTSSRLRQLAGPAGGYAAVGGSFPVHKLCDLLNAMESAGGLPDTVLFPLNMSDQAPLAVLQGSFSQDGISSKVQLGPAWWWCDHKLGIENTLDCISSFGVVSQFIGMTTDSRSVLSFLRHDYFRRLLCSWLDRKNSELQWHLSEETQGKIIENICYHNANKKLGRA